MTLQGKTVLVTGGARRLGKLLSLTLAKAGANVIIHHANSAAAADETVREVEALGVRAWVIQADFADPQAAEGLIEKSAALASSWLCAVIHNAAIFEPLSLSASTLPDWQRHMNINLTAPFLLSRDFAAQIPEGEKGRILTMLDWRSLRPGADHFPYTVTKAGLAGMTRSLAAALAPRITVNGLALGAILPAAGDPNPERAIRDVPMGRWAELDEVSRTALFLLDGPEYITGEILHLDGGRHLI